MTRPCVAIFGQVRGDAVHELVEARTGRPCPCFSGRGCPLLDVDGRSPLLDDNDESPLTRSRVAGVAAGGLATYLMVRPPGGVANGLAALSGFLLG